MRLTATPRQELRRCPTWNALWVFGCECSTITSSVRAGPWPYAGPPVSTSPIKRTATALASK